VAGDDLTGRLLKRVSRSFYLSLAVLPAAVRPPLGIAYLLARAADTIADTRAVERRARVAHLAALRDELEAPGIGRVAAITAALRPGQSAPAERELLQRLPECLLAYRSLPAGDRDRVHRVLTTIIQGQTEDLEIFPGEDEGKVVALATRADLDRYTYLVAGCVGEFWTEVHVAHRPRLAGWDLTRMRALGVRFGKALQLTNVLRDVPRDLRQGRCYLPGEDLARLGLDPSELLDPAAGRAARPLLAELLNVALDHYEAAWEYTFAVPASETRLRLACAWPLLIGLRTLDGVARAPRWLEPSTAVKVPRRRVYGMMAWSLGAVWSNRALRREARRLAGRVAASTTP
jgi:farnesyl-diphosphate farnesyltransferase